MTKPSCTIRVKPKTKKLFDKLVGYNGCVSADDVLNFLLKIERNVK